MTAREDNIMSRYSHQTAPTQFVETGRIRFAYRRFGEEGGVPLVLNQHYLGTMDYWDPLVTDGLARNREVILFNNAGVSSSSGEVPSTFEKMAANGIAFIKALGLHQVDLFGFSIGGLVVQEIALQAPALIRRLIIDGAGPRGGQGMELIYRATERLFSAFQEAPDNVWLSVKFPSSAAGQAAGRAYLKRTHLRRDGRDPEVNDKVSSAQVEAIRKWGAQRAGVDEYLKSIKQPTLVVNGANDVNIPTVNSFLMQQGLPNAQLIIYPDANHGAHHRYPELFVEHASLFLDV
jgi:pimeloyl-ACP methyl ester carboxylesterase